VPRQGRVGIGYSTIYAIEGAPTPEPSLTIDELDRVIAEVQGATGSGSAAKRQQILCGIAVLVRPELVVEVALDGIQVSTRYPGGVALRFAREKRYRPDKSPGEADTVDDLRALLG